MTNMVVSKSYHLALSIITVVSYSLHCMEGGALS